MGAAVTDGVQVVVFRLGSEEYGIDIDLVREIIRWTEVTPVPHAAQSVRGVTNLRGRIVPVIDLRSRFCLGEREASPTERIVVVEVDKHVVGIEVDAATEVLRLDADSIEPPPEVAASEDTRQAMKGVAKVDDRLILLLRLEEVLPLADVAKVARRVGDESGQTDPDSR